MPVQAQPIPMRGPEGGGSDPSGFKIPTPDELWKLRDAASRNGYAATQAFGQYMANLEQAPGAAESGIDFRAFDFPDPAQMDHSFNYASLKGDNPIDIDGAGTNGLVAMIRSQKVMDDYNRKLREAGLEKDTRPATVDTKNPTIRPLPQPEIRKVPGYDAGFPDGGVMPYAVVGTDGHLGAAIHPGQKVGMGAWPSGDAVLDHIDEFIGADAAAIAKKPRDQWTPEDYGVAGAAEAWGIKLPDGLGVLDPFDAPGAVHGGPLPMPVQAAGGWGGAAVQVTPSPAPVRSAAPQPIGKWSQGFFGGPVWNFGSILKSLTAFAQGRQTPDLTPSQKVKETEAEIKTALTTIGPAVQAQAITTGLAGIRWLGAKLQEAGERRGTNVTLQPGQVEGAAQSPGPRALTVGPQHAQEMRALLHYSAERGKVPWTADFINNIPEANLIDIITRQQHAAATFEREQVIRNYENYGEMFFTTAVGLPLEMGIARSLAAGRFTVKQVRNAHQAWAVAERALYEGGANALVGAAFARDGDRLVQGALAGGISGLMPVAGWTGRTLMADAVPTSPGAFTVVASDQVTARFRESLVAGATRNGMDPVLADDLANMLQDYHRSNWAVYGSENISSGVLKSPHVIDSVGDDFVRRGVERSGVGLTEGEIAAVKGVLIDGREVAKVVETVFRDLRNTTARAERIGADAEELLTLSVNPIRGVRNLLKIPKDALRRNRLAGFERYLQGLAKVPGMKDKLGAVLRYNMKAGEDMDALEALMQKLEKVAPSDMPRLIKDAANAQKELHRSAAVLYDHLRKGRARIKSEQAAIDREIDFLFRDFASEVRTFVANDPASQLDLLEKAMIEALHREGSEDTASAALQYSAVSKGIDAIRGRIAQLDATISRSERKMAEAIKKQNQLLFEKVESLERKYLEALDVDSGDIVASRAAARTKLLEAERDAAIKEARKGYSDRIAGARQAAEVAEQERLAGVRQALEEKPYSTWTKEDHALAESLDAGVSPQFMDDDLVTGGLPAIERGIQEDYASRIARATDPQTILEDVKKQTTAKFIADQMNYHRARAYDMSLHANTRNMHKRALEKFDRWKSLKGQVDLHRRTLGRKGLSDESVKLHTDGLALAEAKMASLAPKIPKDPIKAKLAQDAELVMAELMDTQRRLAEATAKAEADFGARLRDMRAEKAQEISRLRDMQQNADTLEELLGRSSAADTAKKYAAIRDQYEGLMAPIRATAGKGRRRPAGLDRDTYVRLQGEYNRMAEAKLALEAQQSAAERAAVISHQEATAKVQAMVLDHVRTIKKSAEAVKAAFKTATEGASDKGLRKLDEMAGRIFDDDQTLIAQFRNTMPDDVPRGKPVSSLPAKEREAMGRALAADARLMDAVAGGADHRLLVGGKRPKVYLRWAEMVGGLPAHSLQTVGDIPIGVAEALNEAMDGGIRESFKRSKGRAIERATRELTGLLAEGREITPSLLDEIEAKHGLLPETLDRKGINGVIQERAKVIKAYQVRGGNGRVAMLEEADDATRSILASQYRDGFSKGRLKAVADELGIADPQSTEAVIATLKRSIATGVRWEAREWGPFKKAVRFFRMRGMSPTGRFLFNNFMVFDDGLGKLGVNVSPILDAIQSGAQREHELAKPLREPLFDAVQGILKLQRDAVAADPRQINELITHYRMARGGAPNIRMTLKETLALADNYGVSHADLDAVAGKLDTFYLAGKSSLEAAYDGIGVIEGTYSPVARQRETPKAVSGRKRKKAGSADMTKKREFGYTTGQEYDALVLARQWYDGFVRGTAYKGVVDEVENTLVTLRGILPDVQTGTQRNIQNPVITAFEEVIEYAQGRGHRQNLPGYVRPFLRMSSNIQAAMLSAPRTAVMNAVDPFVILNSVDFSFNPNRFLQNNRVALNRAMRSQSNIFEAGDYKRVYDILEAHHATGTIDRSSSSSAHIMGLLEGNIDAAEIAAMENNRVIDWLLTLNRYHDGRSRVAAYQMGEDFTRMGVAAANKVADPAKDFGAWFKAFKGDVGVGKYSDGEWNELYHLADEAYGKSGGPAAVQALEEFAGVRLSNTLLFNYFPGAGSLITKNPWLRGVVPFYSYLGARGALMMRAIGRGNAEEIIGAAAIEAAGLGAKTIDRVAGFPFADMVYRSSALVSYMETIRSTTGGNSPDDSAIRNIARAAGPGTAAWALPAISTVRIIGNAMGMGEEDLMKASAWLYQNGHMIPVGSGVNRRKQVEDLMDAAKDLPIDVYNLVMSVAMGRTLYAAIEAGTDTRATEKVGGGEVTPSDYATVYPVFDRIWNGGWRGALRRPSPEEKFATAIENNAWKAAFESFYGIIEGQAVEGRGAEGFGQWTHVEGGPMPLVLDVMRMQAAEKLDIGEGIISSTVPRVLRSGIDELPGQLEGWKLKKAAN